MSPTIVILLVILASVVVSFALAALAVRGGRNRARAHIEALPDPTRRQLAATSLGLASLGPGPLRGTGTLALTDAEVVFAQWRPDRLVRIPRASIVEVDTTRSHLTKTMKTDLLRIRWTSPDAGGEDTIAFFIRDLDAWRHDLGAR